MRYLIVRDSGELQHLLKINDGGAAAVASSKDRTELYESLLRDAGVLVDEVDAPWVFFKKAGVAPVAGAVVVCAARASAIPGKCKCGAPLVRNGVMRGGGPRYSCSTQPIGTTLSGEKPRARGSARRGSSGKPRRGTTRALFEKNPRCPGGHGPMNVRGRAKGVTYYICKKGCPTPSPGKGWSSVNLPTAMDSRRADGGTELEGIVRARVAKLNGHSAQVRDDIVQEILLDLETQAVTLHEVQSSDDVVRRYIRKVQSGEPNKFRDVSLDAPVGDGQTRLSEVVEG